MYRKSSWRYFGFLLITVGMVAVMIGDMGFGCICYTFYAVIRTVFDNIEDWEKKHEV
jgi:hypothetical protein